MAITAGVAASSTGFAGRWRAAIVALFGARFTAPVAGDDTDKGINCLANAIADAMNNDKVDANSQLAGTPCAAAYQTGALALSASVTAILNFDTVEYDTDTAITGGASWHFTCPTGKGGKYHVSAGAGISPIASGTLFELFIHKNGALYRRLGFRFNDAGANFMQLCGSVDLPLAPGDTIDIRVRTSAAGSLNPDATDRDIHISVHRIAGT